jgi:polyhydroxyalkanoate synthesis regulator phasin
MGINWDELDREIRIDQALEAAQRAEQNTRRASRDLAIDLGDTIDGLRHEISALRAEVQELKQQVTALQEKGGA